MNKILYNFITEKEKTFMLMKMYKIKNLSFITKIFFKYRANNKITKQYGYISWITIIIIILEYYNKFAQNRL